MAELELQNVVKYFGSVQAVSGVSLTVKSGELLCILGPSGCGKSTTLRMVGGFESVDAGDISIDGASIAGLPPNKRPTAMVFQKFTLWPHMRVWDNVAFGLKLRRLPGDVIDRKVREALEMVGLPDAARRYPNQLSGGEQQRVALARALVLEPKVLLLDEPLSNLDARLRMRMREEIKRIQRRTGITSVFVTHDQEEALSIADRIAVMSRGRLEQIDSPSQVYARPRTLFVAGFIGTMTTLDAVYRRDARAIEVAGVRLHGPAAAWPDGQKLRVAFRPEDLQPVASRNGANPARLNGATLAGRNDATLAGRVDSVMDLGHFRQLDVQLDAGPMLKVFVPKERVMSAGEAISLAPTRFLAFAGDAETVEIDVVHEPALA